MKKKKRSPFWYNLCKNNTQTKLCRIFRCTHIIKREEYSSPLRIRVSTGEEEEEQKWSLKCLGFILFIKPKRSAVNKENPWHLIKPSGGTWVLVVLTTLHLRFYLLCCLSSFLPGFSIKDWEGFFSVLLCLHSFFLFILFLELEEDAGCDGCYSLGYSELGNTGLMHRGCSINARWRYLPPSPRHSILVPLSCLCHLPGMKPCPWLKPLDCDRFQAWGQWHPVRSWGVDPVLLGALSVPLVCSVHLQCSSQVTLQGLPRPVSDNCGGCLLPYPCSLSWSCMWKPLTHGGFSFSLAACGPLPSLHASSYLFLSWSDTCSPASSPWDPILIVSAGFLTS